MSDFEPCIIVHGGAGDIGKIDDKRVSQRIFGMQEAATVGYQTLLKDGSALDSVEAAVRCMEICPEFNAGYGSYLTAEGIVELDALIMDGSTLNTGAVACVTSIANPVSLARHVMTDTPHCLLVGQGALKFAQKIGFPILKDAADLITPRTQELYLNKLRSSAAVVKEACGDTENRTALERAEKRPQGCDEIEGHDTVGAVAMDRHGRIACATSTGGLPFTHPGRVGDSPLIGSGGYANQVAGASTTGDGESILKVVLAHDVVCRIANGDQPQDACVKAVKRMSQETGGQAGVISLDRHAQFGHTCSTSGMFWASVKEGILKYGARPGEELEPDTSASKRDGEQRAKRFEDLKVTMVASPPDYKQMFHRQHVSDTLPLQWSELKTR